MTYRTKGINALNIVFNNQKNIKILEENIHNNSQNQNEYLLIIQEIINHKRNKKSTKEINNLVQDKLYLYNTSEFDTYKKEINELDDFLNNPFEVDEGVLTCNKCNSNKTFSYTKQTRGGDESTTVFAMCSNCQTKWKI
jgi:DNA-directed RNA polymerase subunit M/transcription elongation factor TFIIS